MAELTCHVMVNKLGDLLDESIRFVGGDTSQVSHIEDYAAIIKDQLIMDGGSEYEIKKLETPEPGNSTTYNLTKDGKPVGASINIPTNHAISTGVSTKDNWPWEGAKKGDTFVKIIVATYPPLKPIYIPIRNIIKEYVGSEYISIDNYNIVLNYGDLYGQFEQDFQHVFAPLNSLPIIDEALNTKIEGIIFNGEELSMNFENKSIDITSVFANSIDDESQKGLTIKGALDAFYTKEETDNKYVCIESYTTDDEIDSIIIK